jgi:2-polyprenyl-6-methoxyphenol hydroxylase-like FAD-dependent oxidoreductase
MRSDPPGGGEPERVAAVIVGGSLSGMMTALTLARAGVGVTILERTGPSPRSGAALGVDGGLLDAITRLAAASEGSTTLLAAAATGSRLPQSWSSIHRMLREAVEADQRIDIRHETTVLSVGQDEKGAWAETSDATFRGHVLIGADGHRSTVRASVIPHKPDAKFAGYVVWLALANEADLPIPPDRPHEVAFLSQGDDFMLGYPVPGIDGSLEPGRRQLGWAWFDASRNQLLRDSGSVTGAVVQHSLAFADIPTATVRELTDSAGQWPRPWRDAVRASFDSGAVVGTPIAEYLPDRLVFGRIALVGDAGHVPTPMTGTGFNASLQDAEVLARALASGVEVDEALLAYERIRLPDVRSMVISGQDFSRSFAKRTG